MLPPGASCVTSNLNTEVFASIFGSGFPLCFFVGFGVCRCHVVYSRFIPTGGSRLLLFTRVKGSDYIFSLCFCNLGLLNKAVKVTDG